MTQELLEMIARPTPSQFFDRLIAPTHSGVCDTSCPDCLRSYSNLAYHNLLDWRLAVDMAALALDPNAQLSLGTPTWARVAGVAATTLLSARTGFNRITVAGLPAVTNGSEVKIVTHPLWRTEQASLGPELAAAWDEAERTRGFRVDSQSFISVFESAAASRVTHARHVHTFGDRETSSTPIAPKEPTRRLCPKILQCDGSDAAIEARRSLALRPAHSRCHRIP
jgi:hypothetical protein